jgi:hypothetical protein
MQELKKSTTMPQFGMSWRILTRVLKYTPVSWMTRTMQMASRGSAAKKQVVEKAA